MDPWPGSGQQHILSNELVDTLHHLGYEFLADVSDEARTSIHGQGWKSGTQLGLRGDLEIEWSRYILGIR